MSGPAGAEDKVDVVGHIVDANYLEWFNPFTLSHGHIKLEPFKDMTVTLFENTALQMDVTLPLHLFSITKQVVMLWISAALCILVFVLLYAKQRLVPEGKGVQSLFEPILLYIRDEVVRPVMGKEGDAFLPYLWTIFFFVFFCNFLGLVPMGATATANVNVTGALALCTFCMIHGSGIKKHGLWGYAKSIVPPVPFFVWPLMLVVELIGLLVKPFALMIRLAANMVAGHAVLLSIMGFIFIFKSWFITAGVLATVTAIFLLELIVAVIQAYIFTFLSTVFIGMAINPDH
jgi:F-type H+-transporting ATPase subunit a